MILQRVDLFADYPLNENGEEEEQENEDPDNPNPNRRIHVSEIVFASSIDINPPPATYPPDVLAKEDEDFAKFEASYLTEVNLPPERLNCFRGPPIVHAPTSTKRGAKQQQQQQQKKHQTTQYSWFDDDDDSRDDYADVNDGHSSSNNYDDDDHNDSLNCSPISDILMDVVK